MTSANKGEARSEKQPSETVEDLQPREDQSAALKGGDDWNTPVSRHRAG